MKRLFVVLILFSLFISGDNNSATVTKTTDSCGKITDVCGWIPCSEYTWINNKRTNYEWRDEWRE